MQQQGDLAVTTGSTAHTDSESLVLDDDGSSPEHLGLHVQFSQSVLAFDHLGPLVTSHLDASRGKRGSFFPGHGSLASSNQNVAHAGMPVPISWPLHDSATGHQPYLRPEAASNDSSSPSAHVGISWNLQSMQRSTDLQSKPSSGMNIRQVLSEVRKISITSPDDASVITHPS